MLNLRSLVLAASIGAALPTSALAGGFTIPTIGARMSGQAVFVAYPDDTSAIYHNPAGLTLIKGYRVDVSALGIYSGTDYRRYEGGYSQTKADGGIISTAPDNATLADSVKPDPPFGVLPNAGFAGDFGLERWRFGLAVYSPHNATGNFPADGAQRYQAIRGTIFTLYTMPTVAFKPLPWLSVAAQVGPAFARIAYERAQSQLVPAYGDAHVDLQGSAWSVAWGVGVLARPIEQLSLGLSYSSSVSMTFRGQLTLSDLHPSVSDAAVIEREGTADFEFPRMLRFGVMWHLSPALMLGADFQWQNYKVYDALRVEIDKPIEMKISQPIVDLVEPKDSSDAFTVAVGGRYSVLSNLDLRAGAMIDTSPYPDETYTILNPDHDKAGFSLGASYRFDFGLELTLAYVHLFYFDRTITETKVCQRLTLGTVETCMPDTAAGGEIHGKMVLLFGGQTSYSF